jgi:hypothetical protein
MAGAEPAAVTGRNRAGTNRKMPMQPSLFVLDPVARDAAYLHVRSGNSYAAYTGRIGPAAISVERNQHPESVGAYAEAMTLRRVFAAGA